MHWRCRSHLLLSLALAAPFVAPSVARAQDASPQTPAPTAPAASPSTSSPPPRARAPAAHRAGSGDACAGDAGPGDRCRRRPLRLRRRSRPRRRRSTPRATSRTWRRKAQRPDPGELAPAATRGLQRRLVGPRAPRSSSCTATSARAAELFHNFFLGRHNSSFQGNDPQYLWPHPARSELLEHPGLDDGQARQRRAVRPHPGADRQLLRQDRVEREHALAPRPRDSTSRTTCGSSRRSTSSTTSSSGRRPNSYATQPATQATTRTSGTTTNVKLPTGYTSAGNNAYAPVGFFSTTQGAPTAGVNGSTNSINVQARLGRVHDARRPAPLRPHARASGASGWSTTPATGSTATTRRRSTASCSSPASSRWTSTSAAPGTSSRPGPTERAPPYDVYGGQPYNTCNLCNVNEWAAFVAHRTNPELQRLKLARGDFVINGGLYTKFRVAVPRRRPTQTTPQTHQRRHGAINNGLEPRAAPGRSPPTSGSRSSGTSSASRRRSRSSGGEIGSTAADHRRPRTTRSTSASSASRRRPSSAPSKTSCDLAVRLRLGERRPVGEQQPGSNARAAVDRPGSRRSYNSGQGPHLDVRASTRTTASTSSSSATS